MAQGCTWFLCANQSTLRTSQSVKQISIVFPINELSVVGISDSLDFDGWQWLFYNKISILKETKKVHLYIWRVRRKKIHTSLAWHWGTLLLHQHPSLHKIYIHQNLSNIFILFNMYICTRSLSLKLSLQLEVWLNYAMQHKI